MDNTHQWNNKSDKQHIAFKAVCIVSCCATIAGFKSRAEELKECLKSRLLLWKNGEINTLLNEGRIIQSRIGKAMPFLNDDISGGVLPLMR